MKLKNRKTGEIVSLEGELTFDDKVRLLKHYNSLAELCEEWEDYEEPKEYWFLNSLGEIIRPIDTEDWEPGDDNYHREIGNYFETKEEAEKAVKRLKAWKRLSDIDKEVDADIQIYVTCKNRKMKEEIVKCLKIIFKKCFRR